MRSYVFIRKNILTGCPVFVVHREWSDVDGKEFTADVNGLENLGRCIAARNPDAPTCQVSSDLDFPGEWNIQMTSNEIFAAIERGISIGLADLMELRGAFHAADEV